MDLRKEVLDFVMLYDMSSSTPNDPSETTDPSSSESISSSPIVRTRS